MSNKEFIDALIMDNNVDAEAAFKDAIATKVGDALENKRTEVQTREKESNFHFYV